MSWLSDWKKRIKITIDHTKIDSDLSNFPVLLKVTYSAVFAELGVNSKKIAVTTSNGVTQNYVEIENWDNENTVAWLWTKVPTVVSGVDTDIYLYYDNSKADNTDYVGDIGSIPAQDVWDSNFVGVWHMSQDPSGGSGCIKDSTSNANHGTPGGSMTSGDLVDGKVGKALDFDGSDDYIGITSTESLRPVSEITISALVYFNVLDERQYIVANEDETSDPMNGYSLRIDSDNTVLMRIGTASSTNKTYSTNTITDKTWYYVAGTYDGSAGIVYFNGINDGNEEFSGAIDEDATEVQIGRRPRTDLPDWLRGIVDEVRLSKIARSASWIKATYHSNWNTLLTYGNEERCIKGYFSGYTFEQNNPVSRKLYLHDRSTGELIATTTSSGNGYYYMETTSSGSHYIVCLDDDAGVEYNDLIIGPAFPITTSG